MNHRIPDGKTQTSSDFFLPLLAAVAEGCPPGSSLGTTSIRKSNWSDLLNAFAMSERERVRLLFESAMIKARAVISAINTFSLVVRTRKRCLKHPKR